MKGFSTLPFSFLAFSCLTSILSDGFNLTRLKCKHKGESKSIGRFTYAVRKAFCQILNVNKKRTDDKAFDQSIDINFWLVKKGKSNLRGLTS